MTAAVVGPEPRPFCSHTGWGRAAAGAEQVDERQMAMPLHVAAHDLAVEDVERGAEGGVAVALVVVGPLPDCAAPHATRLPSRPFFIDRPGCRSIRGAADVS